MQPTGNAGIGFDTDPDIVKSIDTRKEAIRHRPNTVEATKRLESMFRSVNIVRIAAHAALVVDTRNAVARVGRCKATVIRA